MRSKRVVIAVSAALATGGCAHMTTTEQRTLSGAAIGALGGAVIAAVAAGSVATGAAIGAGAGAGAGYLYSRTRNEDSAGHQAGYRPAKRQPVARAAKAPAATPAKDRLVASD